MTIIAIFGSPPELLSKIGETPLGSAAIGGSIWAFPPVLSAFALCRVYVTERSISSVVIGGLGVVTLGLFLLNVRTVIVTPDITSPETGMFVGPLIALFTGCLLGAAILIGEAIN
ncbi:hypothetical protein HALLA_11465 [Halostagnicola larsenii XH-48]|uniref:Uncharacterized protein n=1 Tax=Halostagnicola larsenii XH-48 TaxID=797299 RepID=W0JQM0_9EURY|nr:hypothetical protein [Halostagnicola larsenii]AHG00889.1 hypothetical protein HALLA_11465 [Halostagnicola larsenii XH-48]